MCLLRYEWMCIALLQEDKSKNKQWQGKCLCEQLVKAAAIVTVVDV